MSIIEIVVLGIGLAMDAASVSMANGMIYSNLKKRDYALMPILFGIFQGLMPVLGYFAGSLFQEIITKYSGYVIFIILGFIGGKMIYDSFKREEEKKLSPSLTMSTLLLQALATSIDAFAVGVGFLAISVEIYSASAIIALTTAIVVVIAQIIGKVFGAIFEDKAQLLGGIILIAIGVKALF